MDRYDNVRLHSAIGYVTPNDMLAGRQAKIRAERDRRLEAARLLRKSRRQQAREERAASCRDVASIIGGAAAAASGQ
jgi:hypothetical protein